MHGLSEFLWKVALLCSMLWMRCIGYDYGHGTKIRVCEHIHVTLTNSRGGLIARPHGTQERGMQIATSQSPLIMSVDARREEGRQVNASQAKSSSQVEYRTAPTRWHGQINMGHRGACSMKVNRTHSFIAQ